MKDPLIYKILDVIPSPAFFVNLENTISHINKRLEKEFGDITGEDYSFFLAQNDKIKKGNKQTIISRQGNHFQPDLLAYNDGENKIGQLCILQDITEIRKLKDYVKYLENLNRGLNKIYQKQERLLEKLTQQALTDGLTGLYNHRHFWEQASIEMKRANRYSEPLSCLMIDIDNFKFVNDRYNHQFGDSVLRRIATILKTPLRATDILARYGGDEFSVLLPNTDYQGSQVISKKIIKRVRESNFKVKDSSTTVTISLGVSSYPVDQIMDPSQLVEYADTALYEAKAKGKDQICFFHEMKHIPFN